MKIRSIRNGVTTIEVMVSAVLLMTVMTFVTTLCLRISLVWKDVGHRRVAVCELANQLEVLTLLSPTKAAEAIENLKASEDCGRTLNNPQLSGSLDEDELGTRVTLSLNWKRRVDGRPVELSGWVVSASAVEKPETESSVENDEPSEEKSLEEKGSQKKSNGDQTEPEEPKPEEPETETPVKKQPVKEKEQSEKEQLEPETKESQKQPVKKAEVVK